MLQNIVFSLEFSEGIADSLLHFAFALIVMSVVSIFPWCSLSSLLLGGISFLLFHTKQTSSCPFLSFHNLQFCRLCNQQQSVKREYRILRNSTKKTWMGLCRSHNERIAIVCPQAALPCCSVKNLAKGSNSRGCIVDVDCFPCEVSEHSRHRV